MVEVEHGSLYDVCVCVDGSAVLAKANGIGLSVSVPGDRLDSVLLLRD